MNNQQSVEAAEAIGTGINLGFKMAEDGKLDYGDALSVIPQIPTLQKGVIGFGQIPNESAVSGIPEKDARKEALARALVDLPELTKYDLGEGLHGIWCLLDLGIRIGRAKGAKEAISKMNRGESLVGVQSADELTDEQVTDWLNS